ncbi:hypothetical protein KKB18_13800, partial [bacterium]|nr:hypothetical protein [bacterium]
MFDIFRHHDIYSSVMRKLLQDSINSPDIGLSLFDNACTVVYKNEAAEIFFRSGIGDHCCKNFKDTKKHSNNCLLEQVISK